MGPYTLVNEYALYSEITCSITSGGVWISVILSCKLIRISQKVRKLISIVDLAGNDIPRTSIDKTENKQCELSEKSLEEICVTASVRMNDLRSSVTSSSNDNEIQFHLSD